MACLGNRVIRTLRFQVFLELPVLPFRPIKPVDASVTEAELLLPPVPRRPRLLRVFAMCATWGRPAA